MWGRTVRSKSHIEQEVFWSMLFVSVKQKTVVVIDSCSCSHSYTCGLSLQRINKSSVRRKDKKNASKEGLEVMKETLWKKMEHDVAACELSQ